MKRERVSCIVQNKGTNQQDNEIFVKKLRERIDRVNITLPEVEIRYEQLRVDAEAYLGGRALPTLLNATLNTLESFMSFLKLLKSKKKPVTILKGITSVIKPGRMTLLLGPPGAGQTTLLLALAGKLDKSLKVSSKVTYNGHSMREFVPQRTSVYISQNDLHIGEMTVRKTMDFSARCQGVGNRYAVLAELSRREKDQSIKPDPDIDFFMKAIASEGQKSSILTDYILKLLGLEVCSETMVGDDMRRGISGGQKKRVTTGEMMISTGLDSSTTFQIVNCLRQFVHVFSGSLVASLLQPAPETYDLFDDIILLCEGQVVYHGPRESILDFFHMMGFRCPERKGVADFLQEFDKNQRYRYIPVQEFADAFQSFHVGREMQSGLSVPYDKSKCHPAALVRNKYGLTKMELFKACFDREVLLMKRSAFIFIFKAIQIAIVATMTTTVFLRTEMGNKTLWDGSKYMGVLFCGLVNAMFNGLAELQMTIVKLSVFYKQRDAKFFPAWAYTLPTFLMRIPISLLEFFRQFFLLFNLHQMSLSLFRFIGALGRNQIISNTFGAFALLVIFVLGGFIVSREDIYSWWKWGYWSSPLMYAQNAVAVNEFLSNRWIQNGVHIGQLLLKIRGIFTEANWYWIGIGALMGYNVLFNILYTLALKYLDPLGKPQASITEDTSEGKHEDQIKVNGHLNGKVFGKSHSLSCVSLLVGDSTTTNGMKEKKGMVLPFKPLALAFKEIKYFVDMPAEMKAHGEEQDRLQLLQGVSGSFRPGLLTCLMGVRGAGKTSLMDVLAEHKTGGYIEGSISISGYSKKQETFARISGYCEQNDIHSPNLTVHESLLFSAWLRLPADVQSHTRKAFVEEVMELVELNNLREALVGVPGVNGLSTEQRKRLTIGVELIANPSIIFMDEPTSGVDARAAAIVMRTVRNTVDTGRTVVCTIHQPSIDICESFDELFLMKRGGQVIYAGPLGTNSQQLTDYFQSIEGVPEITSGYNPATWMLEVTSIASENGLQVDFANIYANSPLYERNMALIEELSKPTPGSQDLHFETQFSQPFMVQAVACLWKQHWSYWRNPQYNAVRFFFTLVAALLFGSIFWDMGSKIEQQQDFLNAMGSMFSEVLFLGVNNASSVQSVVDIERSVFYRERAAGMFSALPYALGQVLVELPYVFVQTAVYGVVVYCMIGFDFTLAKFLWFLFFMFFTFLYYTYYGMMTVALTPNATFASILSSAFYGVWMLFTGFLLPRTSIPGWWRWYYWGCPITWTLYGLMVSQFGNVTKQLLTAEGNPVSLRDFLNASYGFDYDMLPWVACVVVGYAILFALVFALSIRTLNFQAR
ncbi:hypothetical protein AMTRI_Chr12g234600 [Amborella trichopoda]